MMNHFRRYFAKTHWAVTTLAAWLIACANALAQQPQQAPPEADYVMSYGLVLLCIALAMLVICRASRRRDRARPESYEESKPH